MTVLERPPDVIEREPVRVMLATCPDEIGAIQQLWPWFEDVVGLRGRRMYAAADLASGTYSACTPVRPDDDAAALGLDLGELPGGRFLRGRLRGGAPELYGWIGPGFEELEAAGPVDRTRPVIEFYKRHDEIELWVPLPS